MLFGACVQLSLAGENEGQVRPEISGENGLTCPGFSARLLQSFPRKSILTFQEALDFRSLEESEPAPVFLNILMNLVALDGI